jgi:fucose permease
MLGSLALPHIAAIDPRLGYVALMILAAIATMGFEALRPRYDPFTRGEAAVLGLREAVLLLAADRDLGRLALASIPYAAMQLALNAFLVIYAVERLGLGLIWAGALLATAQGGGLVGRLVWGLVARAVPPKTLIVGLGIGMSVAAVILAFATPAWPLSLLFGIAFLFGLSASGWNGIFLAEVARLAPEGRIAEATGAVLMACFSGLVIGPLVVAAVAAVAGLAAAYAVLAAATLAGTLLLVR